MIVNLFRHTQVLTIFTVMMVCTIVWMGLSFQPIQSSTNTNTLFFDFAFGWLTSNLYLERISVGLIVFSQCISMNRIMAKQKIISINSSFPALFYLILISLSPEAIYLSPNLIAISFIQLAINKILSTYLQKEPYNLVFEGAFFLGLSALIYPPFFVFIPLCWIGMSIFSQIEWRHWVLSSLGVLCPWFLFYTTTTYLKINTGNYFNEFESIFVENVVTTINIGDLIVLLAFGILTLISVAELIISLRQKNIKARKSYVLLLWILLTGFVYFYLSPDAYHIKLLIFAMPLSAIVTNYYYYNKKIKWLNAFTLVLIGILITNHLAF